MYQGPVMTDIQRSLAEQQFRHGWKEASDYHSHPNTDLKLKLREISTTLELFVSGATMKPCPQLYPSLNLHLSLPVTLFLNSDPLSAIHPSLVLSICSPSHPTLIALTYGLICYLSTFANTSVNRSRAQALLWTYAQHVGRSVSSLKL